MNTLTQSNTMVSYTFSLPPDNNEDGHLIFFARNDTFDNICRRIAKIREDEMNAFIASLEKF